MQAHHIIEHTMFKLEEAAPLGLNASENTSTEMIPVMLHLDERGAIIPLRGEMLFII